MTASEYAKCKKILLDEEAETARRILNNAGISPEVIEDFIASEL
jgi:hypothetical protein